MNRFLLGALAMGAVFVLTSFSVTRSATTAPEPCSSTTAAVFTQDPTPRPGPTGTTVSYYHDSPSGTHSAFVWEWKGNDLVASTRYTWSTDTVTKRRVPVTEEKK